MVNLIEQIEKLEEEIEELKREIKKLKGDADPSVQPIITFESIIEAIKGLYSFSKEIGDAVGITDVPLGRRIDKLP